VSEMPDAETRLAHERKMRDKADKRAAAANVENARLQKELRALDWKYRALHVAVEADQYHARKLRVAQERLALLRDIVNAPIDDWMSL
jgi:hypothetical protein